MREIINECDMVESGTLDIATRNDRYILGDIDGGHRRRNRKGIRLAKKNYLIYGNNVMGAQMFWKCLYYYCRSRMRDGQLPND